MLKKFKSFAKDWADGERKKFQKVRSFKFRTLTMCDKCYSFYYKNSWHFKRPEYLEGYREEEMHVRFTKCPACVEEEESLYEMESSGLGLGFGG